SFACRRPRLAIDTLEPPVAPFLRPSGAADPCKSDVQTRPFLTGKRPTSPRRGAGLLPRVERSRRRSATRGKSRELLSRPGGAEDGCHGWSGAGGGAPPVGPGRA